MALPSWLLVSVGGRRYQRPWPSPTLGLLWPSHQRRHKSRVSLGGPLCAHGVLGVPYGEVRENEGWRLKIVSFLNAIFFTKTWKKMMITTMISPTLKISYWHQTWVVVQPCDKLLDDGMHGSQTAHVLLATKKNEQTYWAFGYACEGDIMNIARIVVAINMQQIP